MRPTSHQFTLKFVMAAANCLQGERRAIFVTVEYEINGGINAREAQSAHPETRAHQQQQQQHKDTENRKSFTLQFELFTNTIDLETFARMYLYYVNDPLMLLAHAPGAKRHARSDTPSDAHEYTTFKRTVFVPVASFKTAVHAFIDGARCSASVDRDAITQIVRHMDKIVSKVARKNLDMAVMKTLDAAAQDARARVARAEKDLVEALRKRAYAYEMRESDYGRRAEPGHEILYVQRTNIWYDADACHPIIKVGKTVQALRQYEKQLKAQYATKIDFATLIAFEVPWSHKRRPVDSDVHVQLFRLAKQKVFLSRRDAQTHLPTAVHVEFYILSDTFIKFFLHVLDHFFAKVCRETVEANEAEKCVSLDSVQLQSDDSAQKQQIVPQNQQQQQQQQVINDAKRGRRGNDTVPAAAEPERHRKKESRKKNSEDSSFVDSQTASLNQILANYAGEQNCAPEGQKLVLQEQQIKQIAKGAPEERVKRSDDDKNDQQERAAAILGVQGHAVQQAPCEDKQKQHTQSECNYFAYPADDEDDQLSELREIFDKMGI